MFLISQSKVVLQSMLSDTKLMFTYHIFVMIVRLEQHMITDLLQYGNPITFPDGITVQSYQADRGITEPGYTVEDGLVCCVPDNLIQYHFSENQMLIMCILMGMTNVKQQQCIIKCHIMICRIYVGFIYNLVMLHGKLHADIILIWGVLP